VIGSTPTPASAYPPGPNWSADPVPQENPLGYCVNDLNPSAADPSSTEVALPREATPDPGRSQVSSPLAERNGLGLSSRTYRRF
jgi:hypothetical protein